MVPRITKQRFEGYPAYDLVLQGIAQQVLKNSEEVVYQACQARLHNLSRRRTQALLQTFRNLTLAANWVLNEVEKRHTYRYFPQCRKKYSTHYDTQKIARTLAASYKRRVDSKFTLSSSITSGLWHYLARMLSSWLQQVAEGRKKGYYVRYHNAASHVIKLGRHTGKTIGEVGRNQVKGYLALPTRGQCEQALYYINILLNEFPEDEVLQKEAKDYKLPITEYEGVELGKRQLVTLKKIKMLVERDLERMEYIDELKATTTIFLSWSPPGFPTIKRDGISTSRQQALAIEHVQALEAYGADVEFPLAETEHHRFRRLQQAAYADTAPPFYIPILWPRADAILRHREMGIGYDSENNRYELLAYFLAEESRYKTKLKLPRIAIDDGTQHEPASTDKYSIRTIVDTNNPSIILKETKRSIQAMRFSLDYGYHHGKLLDRARQESAEWKQQFIARRAKRNTEKWGTKTDSTAGCVRSGSLHAYFNKHTHQWWFQLYVSVGTRSTHVKSPDHVIGVHVDQKHGLTATVLTLRGKWIASYHLNETTIAQILGNKPSEGDKDPAIRAATEYHHRLAESICRLANRYCAYVGIENIDYMRTLAGKSPVVGRNGSECIRTVKTLLVYKLRLCGLPQSFEIWGVAPKRDCSLCGYRHGSSTVKDNQFICQYCGGHIQKQRNASQEVARRLLWDTVTARLKA